MLKELFEKVINSQFLKKVKEVVGNFINSFGSSDAKEKVDEYFDSVEKTDSVNETLFSGLNAKASKFVKKKLSGNIKSTKIINAIAKIISVILAMGFGALVIYAMIKILPTVIMAFAVVMAIVLSISLVDAILNKAVTPAKAAK